MRAAGPGEINWVLVCGSRGWHDAAPIGRLMDLLEAQYGDTLGIVHGGAKGADILAHAEASRRGIRTAIERADWNQYRKGAGPIRNQKMLDDYQPIKVHAFRSAGKSSGTDDMCEKARKAGVPVYIHTIEYRDYEPVTDAELAEVLKSIADGITTSR
jgi:hypothetical protein